MKSTGVSGARGTGITTPSRRRATMAWRRRDDSAERAVNDFHRGGQDHHPYKLKLGEVVTHPHDRLQRRDGGVQGARPAPPGIHPFSRHRRDASRTFPGFLRTEHYSRSGTSEIDKMPALRYYQNTQGLIFVVDSNDRDRVDNARDELPHAQRGRAAGVLISVREQAGPAERDERRRDDGQAGPERPAPPPVASGVLRDDGLLAHGALLASATLTAGQRRLCCGRPRPSLPLPLNRPREPESRAETLVRIRGGATAPAPARRRVGGGAFCPRFPGRPGNVKRWRKPHFAS